MVHLVLKVGEGLFLTFHDALSADTTATQQYQPKREPEFRASYPKPNVKLESEVYTNFP